jgi:hypothetical protein
VAFPPLPPSRAMVCRSSCRAGLAAFAVLALTLAAPASRAADENPPSLSDATGEALGKLKPLVDAKNWDASLALLNGLLPTVEANSYDQAIILDTKSKILLQKSDYSGALEPMEKALEISDARHFFPPRQTLDMIYFLAQLYYQEGGATGVSRQVQLADFDKSAQYLQRWLKLSPKPSEDVAVFYASILYNQAIAANPEKPDPTLVKRAQVETEKALHLTQHPKESLYVLLLATLQQQGDFEKSADILEFLVSKYPNNKAYWQQLMGLYLNLASTHEKDEKLVRKYDTRAVLAIERAQSHGFMKTPKDNYNLVTIYYNLGQFGRATDLLYAGLKNGTIDSDIKNWELLAYSYQQIDQGPKAIEALKEAQNDPRFANNGQIDYQIGQIYSELDKSSEAYAAYQAAVLKPGLEKPFSVYMFLAYSAFELQKFDDALKAVVKAEAYPEAQRDKQLGRLKAAIQEAIKERDAMLQVDKKT